MFAMSNIVNIASYKFVHLTDLAERREELRAFTKSAGLRGTILLSHEGINLFMAGTRKGIDSFVELLKSKPEFSDMEFKESLSDEIPYRRMLVKIKREIITFDVDGIDPARETAQKIKAEELKAWLDRGEPVTLLDVRNDYEVEVGTFEKAEAIGIGHFRHFPEAVKKLPAELKQRPIVMFCTGGIRCEKAGPLMMNEGFQNVLQLDGGILKYFETCGDDHYQGDCFVFDQRVAVDGKLRETETTQCFACQAVLTQEDQESDQYVVGRSCPHCHLSTDEQIAECLDRRRKQIAEVASPLPGSQPYDNRRPLNVPGKCDGWNALRTLSTMHPHVNTDEWSQVFAAGQITRDDKPIAPDTILRAGERIERLFPATVEPDVNANVTVLHEDSFIVVINKPAPLPMHPSGQFNRNTLMHLLNQVYYPQRLRVVHRLDANTTGVVLLARTRTISAKIHPQFKACTTSKTYVARVQGHPLEDKFVCDSAIDSVSQAGGARRVDDNGKHAETQFEVLSRREDGTSLVKCVPITGRTNQIRIHLAHLGFPIVGDPTYLAEGEYSRRQTLSINDPPMCLHAQCLELDHPEDGKRGSI